MTVLLLVVVAQIEVAVAAGITQSGLLGTVGKTASLICGVDVVLIAVVLVVHDSLVFRGAWLGLDSSLIEIE